MKKIKTRIKEYFDELKCLFRSIPSIMVSLYILSVVCANLMANKELISYHYITLDCGIVFSWMMFLFMDVICKLWGPRASVRVSIFALLVNFAVTVVFFLLSLTPGKWAAYYLTENIEVNDALNATFAFNWFIVVGSSLDLAISSVLNAVVNSAVAKLFKKNTNHFGEFAARSYISTAVGQFVDNFIFAVIVSKILFGWSWTQICMCSLVASAFELVAEIIFSGFAYSLVRRWQKEGVAKDYIEKT